MLMSRATHFRETCSAALYKVIILFLLRYSIRSESGEKQ